MGPRGCLRILDGARAGEGVDLADGDLRVGRAAGCDLHLPDPTVSKDQAEIRCSARGVVLENRSERNPCSVNGEEVRTPRTLRDGDRIAMGTVNLVFDAPRPAPAAPPPPPRRAPAAPPRPEEPPAPPAPAGGGHGTRALRRPWLVVGFPGGVSREETLYADVMRIGRGAENEIQVDFPTVSGRHATLELKGGRYSITDAGSTNGTTVNGRALEGAHELADGDIVRMGDPSGNSVSLTYREEGAEVRDALSTIAIRRLAVEGKDSFVLGRDPACDVHLEGSLVSWRHAKVERAEGGHVVTDLGSTNGTFVNGQQVKGRRLLKPGDVIRIGPTKFVYTSGGFSQSSSAGRVRVDGVGLRREVGGAKARRVLLNDISLTIQAREFVCFVGGSGAGKSTLMKAFAGIFRVEGDVLVNGEDLRVHYDEWKGMIGYVPQDDIVHGDLTVDHAVRYAARLRLPKDTRDREIDAAVDRVLGDVEMLPHRDKLIRSLSGGQRKRVSIAVEMLSEPSLFFLDEPTSGLDPGLEKKMMYMMRRLADGGRTIIMVTHATANITQCDHVAFLARGRLVWYGPPAEALEHFGVRDFSDIYTEIEKDPEGLEKRYRASAAFRKYVLDRQKLLSATRTDTGSLRAGPPPVLERRTAGSIRQFGILTRRYAELVFRDRLLLLILLAVMPVIGLMLGVMAKRHDFTGMDEAGIQRELAAETSMLAVFPRLADTEKLLFMGSLAVVLLGLFGAAYEVVKERPVYRRERMVNLRIAPYLLSKVVVLFGFALVQCAALLGILLLFVDPPPEGILMRPDAEMYVTLALTALASILMGLLLSALAPNSNTVIYIVLLVVFCQILLTGTIFTLPAPAEPASRAMVTRWSVEALGSTVDMDRLNAQTSYLIRKEESRTVPIRDTVKVEHAPKPSDFGKAFEDMVASGAIEPPKPVTIEKEVSLETKVTINLGEKSIRPEAPKKPYLGYGHDRNRLHFLWSALGGFAVCFFALTAFTLALRDRQEG
ncbi:MAG: FHA domain-containing protein [Planctomycetes bacterium]|nr:FHA domain-containing protein [Planctomycetota bacterium]